MSVRVVAVVNPRACDGRAEKRWPSIEARLRHHVKELEVRFTEAAGHATQLTREALESGADMVISVGGDGTNNEVLCGFVDADGSNRFPEAQMGIIAAGTGGDFQRMFGSGRWAEQVDRMWSATPRSIDYGVSRYTTEQGESGIRPFLNMASVGVTAEAVRLVNDSGKALGANASYVAGAVRGILSHRNKAVEVRVDGREGTRRVDLTLACVGNGQYFGAGMWACPKSKIDDGRFDLIEVAGVNRVKLMGLLAKVFKGRHLGAACVQSSKVRWVEFGVPWSKQVVRLELDGEPVGILPARFEIKERALKIRVG